MRFIKHLTTWLLLLTVLTASGVVSAKVVSGVQNFTGGLHQENVSANALMHLAKIDFSYDDASGFPLVPKSGTSVLGKFPDYMKLSGELGAKRFSIPTDIWNKMSKAEQWGANRKFLDRMISRGDDIVLSNRVKNIDDVSGAFRQELDYLINKGFRISSDGLRMVK